MRTPDDVTGRLPGFGALFELGFSEILRVFRQSVGWNSGYALRTDGTVWKWESRQVLVGDGFEPVRYVTKQLDGLDGVTQLVGNYQSGSVFFALRADGTVWGWGDEYFCERMGNSSSGVDTPVQMQGFANVQSLVTARDGGGLRVLTGDGEVWAWDSDLSDRTAGGLVAERYEFQRIPVLEDVAEIVWGLTRFLARQSTGEVWVGASISPTRIGNLPPVVSLPRRCSGGRRHSLGVGRATRPIPDARTR